MVNLKVIFQALALVIIAPLTCAGLPAGPDSPSIADSHRYGYNPLKPPYDPGRQKQWCSLPAEHLDHSHRVCT